MVVLNSVNMAESCSTLFGISDPVVWSTIAQTIVLTLTLVIFILSFRSQNQATKEAAYQKALDDYTDTMKMLVENPQLSKLPLEMARANQPIGTELQAQPPENMVVRNYMLLLYGIFERIHLLYRKKWIDSDTWNQWGLFLQAVTRHPAFRDVHRTSEGMFDKPFQDYVSNILSRKRSE